MSTDKWASSKFTQLSTKVWVKLLLLLENSIINKHTEQVKKLHAHMDLSWHALNSVLKAKTFYHTEKQGFGYPWLSKNFQTHPPKPTETEPSFKKVSEPPAKLCMLFLWVRDFWPQIYSL